MIKFLKTCNKEKIVKSARGKKKTHGIERNKFKDDSRIVLGNNASKKETQQHFENVERMIPLNLEFYT